MAGALRKTMVYLGLSDDERYNAQDETDQSSDRDRDRNMVDDIEPEHEAPLARQRDAQVTPIRTAQAVRSVPAPVGELRRITTIHPRSYNDAKAIGASFRDGTPVIMNLTDMDDSDAKRLVDFSAGLIFGLHGSIERVTAKVFLLSPEHVEVAGEASIPEQTQASFFNQS
ncbi:cell division protein SepF [Saxibacter everestensis]|uniref:Cell division protein SepF n=1 Tax=Saxibacter everestensis TaxID=2909229 RepID=A0ABY8QYN9_9MICO|nr:cell division protein SepF [Brevibacteriaceae bacterium ZFBP1038]